VDGTAPSIPQTAAIIQRWRARMRLSKQRFAELADVSATYVRTIEAGVDDDGRQVIPSAGIIRKLASGLARAGATPAEDRQAYAELMAAAGYVDPSAVDTIALPGGLPNPLSPFLRREGGTKAGDRAGRADSKGDSRGEDSPGASDGRGDRPLAPTEGAGRGDGGEGSLVPLRDHRLLDHLVPLLERWDELSPEDQSLLLGIAEFVAERQRRRDDGRDAKGGR
jgi:transcriptional regulator with XRE-family HTH domain